MTTSASVDLSALRDGAFVVVRYGRKGEQLARFYRPMFTGASRFRGYKWLANSQEWTNALTIEGPAVLRHATAVDFHKFRYSHWRKEVMFGEARGVDNA